MASVPTSSARRPRCPLSALSFETSTSLPFRVIVSRASVLVYFSSNGVRPRESLCWESGNPRLHGTSFATVVPTRYGRSRERARREPGPPGGGVVQAIRSRYLGAARHLHQHRLARRHRSRRAQRCGQIHVDEDLDGLRAPDERLRSRVRRRPLPGVRASASPSRLRPTGPGALSRTQRLPASRSRWCDTPRI